MRVDVRRDDGDVVVVVADDGVGGADLERGTGLRGLRTALSALDGTLELESPPGGGTRLRARSPARRGATLDPRPRDGAGARR